MALPAAAHLRPPCRKIRKFRRFGQESAKMPESAPPSRPPESAALAAPKAAAKPPIYPFFTATRKAKPHKQTPNKRSIHGFALVMRPFNAGADKNNARVENQKKCAKQIITP